MSKYILGIHDGHNCGAAISKDGKIVVAICEERLTRRKNEVGFPEYSIKDALRIAGICGGDLESCVFASFFMHSPDHLRNLESWYAVGSREQQEAESKPAEYDQVILEHRQKARTKQAMDLLGIPREKVLFLEHHEAHLAAAYFTSPYGISPVLGITCDGAGDGLSATVSICDGNKIERIATTNRHASLGKIYSRMTFMMGMKPWEHEYKVMGLAPYADQHLSILSSAPFFDLLRVRKDGLGFEKVNGLSTNYCYDYLRDSFQRTRFDAMAGAVQFFTEDMLTELVRSAIYVTGIHDIVCGGGVFMNVKANKAIAALPEVNSMYVMPSAADESLAIGACLHRYYLNNDNADHSQSIFDNLYLGGEFNQEDEEQAINDVVAHREYYPGFNFYPARDVDTEIIDLIRRGKIVARFNGRMEWGARALGNRSILARADDYTVVDRLNRAIKMRDFWMPFAPSITTEAANEYIDDPKDLRPYYMTYAFDTKEHSRRHLIAAIHPQDHTTRPQIIDKRGNLRYHNIVEECGGAVLNTSFNLHGYPIVYSPADALQVFLDSGLEYLALDHFMVKKEG